MAKTVIFGDFECDEDKEKENIKKHGVDFETGARTFLDPRRVITKDEKHSQFEQRKYCIRNVNGTILTVRYTMSGKRIRIFGAASWRKRRKTYGEENKKRS